MLTDALGVDPPKALRWVKGICAEQGVGILPGDAAFTDYLAPEP